MGWTCRVCGRPSGRSPEAASPSASAEPTSGFRFGGLRNRFALAAPERDPESRVNPRPASGRLANRSPESQAPHCSIASERDVRALLNKTLDQRAEPLLPALATSRTDYGVWSAVECLRDVPRDHHLVAIRRRYRLRRKPLQVCRPFRFMDRAFDVRHLGSPLPSIDQSSDKKLRLGVKPATSKVRRSTTRPSG